MATQYTNYEDLKQYYTVNDFPKNELKEPDIELINSAIETACIFIDQILETAKVPFPVSAENINQLRQTARSISRYRYKERQGQMNDFIKEEYNTQLSYLNKIKNNEISLKDTQKKAGLYNIFFDY